MDNDTIAHLLGLIGEPELPQALLESVSEVFPADHLGIDLHLPDQKIYSIGRGSLSTFHSHNLLSTRYGEGSFSSVDPALKLLQSKKPHQTRPVFIVMGAEEIENKEYRSTIFDMFGVVQRVMLADKVRNQWFWIKLVRHQKLGMASEEELEKLNQLAPLLINIARWHVIIVQRRAAATKTTSVQRAGAFLVQLDRGLSPREIEVCCDILEGLSNPEIADRLGVKVSTVATLRRRAFYKLEISSSAELFKLFLAQFFV